MRKTLLLLAATLAFFGTAATAQDKLIGVQFIENDTLGYEEFFKFNGNIRNYSPTNELLYGLGELGNPNYSGADSVIAYQAYNNRTELQRVVNYDAQRRPLVEVWYYRDDVSYTNLFAYHTNGNIKSKTYIISDSSQMETESFYDDGRIESIVEMSKLASGDTLVRMSIYEYSPTKQLLVQYDSIKDHTIMSGNWGLFKNEYHFANSTAKGADSVIISYLTVNASSYGLWNLEDKQFFTYNSAGDTLVDSFCYLNSSNSYEVRKFFYDGDNYAIYTMYDAPNGVDTLNRFFYSVDPTTRAVTTKDIRFSKLVSGPVFDWASANVIDADGYIQKGYSIDSNGVALPNKETNYIRFANKNIDSIVYVYDNFNAVTRYIYDTAPTSIDEVFNHQNITLFPNPSNGIVNISVDGVQEYDVALYNVTGQLLGYYNAPKQLDISARAAGQYFLQIIDVKSKQSVTKPIVKK